MPSQQPKPLSRPSHDAADYGPIFQHDRDASPLELGKRWVAEALQILNHRQEKNRTLRTIALPKSQRTTLLKRSFDFLQTNQNSAFEEDNLKHVGRLISNMKVHGEALKEFLDMDVEDVQLLAALHDLGKAKVPLEMNEFLLSLFGKDDFLGLRVLPHELFSFFWIEHLGMEVGVTQPLRHLLMDQIANHNLGPNLTDPHNNTLLEKDENGRYQHWWVEHWAHWSVKAQKAGLNVQSIYGHTISPLANTLVLFDRIDGGHPHSWEKFLNQDLISGHLEYSPEGIIEVMDHANITSREQLKAVGRQLRTHFTVQHEKTAIDDFPPYQTAIAMLKKNDLIVQRLKACNTDAMMKEHQLIASNSILYSDKMDRWFRFDAEKTTSRSGKSYEFIDGKWKLIKESGNPVALLLDHIYRDWR